MDKLLLGGLGLCVLACLFLALEPRIAQATAIVACVGLALVIVGAIVEIRRERGE